MNSVRFRLFPTGVTGGHAANVEVSAASIGRLDSLDGCRQKAPLALALGRPGATRARHAPVLALTAEAGTTRFGPIPYDSAPSGPVGQTESRPELQRLNANVANHHNASTMPAGSGSARELYPSLHAMRSIFRCDRRAARSRALVAALALTLKGGAANNVLDR